MAGLLSEPDTSDTAASSVDATSSAGRFIRPGILVEGDALSFVTFAAVGMRSHGVASGSNVVLEVLWTAVPFAAGWFLVSPWLGVFRHAQTTGMVRMLMRTELAWLCSWPLTLVLRWALSADHNIPLFFALVILIVNAVFLGVWRSVFALIAGLVGRK